MILRRVARVAGEFASSARRIIAPERFRRQLGAWNDIILLHDINLAYITVPKTANTTVKTVLAESLGLLDSAQCAALKDDAQNIHRILRDMPDVALSPTNSDEILAGFRAFATVRHPVSRFESFYRDKIRGAGWDEKIRKKIFRAYGFTGLESPDEVVLKIADVPDELAEIHFRSQSAIVDAAPWRNVRIFRMESLDELWTWLFQECERAEVTLEYNVEKRNVTQRDRQSPLSDKSISLLEQRYANDFARFGYGDS